MTVTYESNPGIRSDPLYIQIYMHVFFFMGRQCRQYSDLKYMFLFSFIWAVFKIYLRKLEHVILIFYVLFKILYMLHFYMLFRYFICCSKFYMPFRIFICCSDILYAVQNFICRSEFLYAVQIFYMLFTIDMLFKIFICCSNFLYAN